MQLLLAQAPDWGRMMQGWARCHQFKEYRAVTPWHISRVYMEFTAPQRMRHTPQTLRQINRKVGCWAGYAVTVGNLETEGHSQLESGGTGGLHEFRHLQHPWWLSVLPLCLKICFPANRFKAAFPGTPLFQHESSQATRQAPAPTQSSATSPAPTQNCQGFSLNICFLLLTHQDQHSLVLDMSDTQAQGRAKLENVGQDANILDAHRGPEALWPSPVQLTWQQ